MSFVTCIYVAAGGALGSLARYLISIWALPVSRELPWGTIGINLAGSLLIGFFGTMTLAHGRYPVSENWRLFVMVGICGGFTTFSSFSLQTLDLMRSGAMLRAGANIVVSVVLCVAAVAFGHFLAAQFNQNAQQVAQISIEEEGLSDA
jgi:fluoride exporter